MATCHCITGHTHFKASFAKLTEGPRFPWKYALDRARWKGGDNEKQVCAHHIRPKPSSSHGSSYAPQLHTWMLMWLNHPSKQASKSHLKNDIIIRAAWTQMGKNEPRSEMEPSPRNCAASLPSARVFIRSRAKLRVFRLCLHTQWNTQHAG